ncbi:MAG: VWA domain-containing protein [Pyrinomonadaceae bacterium]
MSPNNSVQKRLARRARVHALRVEAVSAVHLFLRASLVCIFVLPCALHARDALATQSQASQQTWGTPQPAPTPAPTPYVRQRTVEKNIAPPPASDAAGPTGAAAATQESQEVGEDEVVRVNSNLVLVPASVVDSRGRAITDLKVNDFELRVDGQLKPISDLNRAETPVHVALLFDNSASLSAARAFEKQAATRFFASVVRTIDRAAVYSISTVPRLEQGFTNDVPRLVRTIERFGQPEGATALFDAISQATNYLRPIDGRKVIVIVSDGTDTVSDINFDATLQSALRADCQIYVVQTRQLEDPNLHDLIAEQRLAKITEQTGGAVFVPQAVGDLDAVFTQISLDLSQQYVLSYYPQDDRADKYFRFITLRVKTNPGLRVRARRGFYPSSSTQSAQQVPAEDSAVIGKISSVVTTGNIYNAASPRASAPVTKERADGTSDTLTFKVIQEAGTNRRIGPDSLADNDRPVSQSAASKSDSAKIEPLNPRPGDAAPTSPEKKSAAASSSSSTSSGAAPATPNDSRAADDSAQSATTTRQATPDKEAAAVNQTIVSGGVLNGKALSLPSPLYPPTARTAGVWGVVVVEVTISEDGRVTGAHALSGHPLLQGAAVSAAKLAKFSPTLLSGMPVKVLGTINYAFARP